MIASFSVSNFRSFASEETLSMVASNRLSGSHDDHAVPIPDSKERVLRAAVLYGANGAGKSNLFKALGYLKTVALNPRSRNSGTGREAFRLGDPAVGTSDFDLQFIVADRLYRFGFKVDDERITEEWLFQVVGNRQKPLYERTTDEKGRVAVDAAGLKDAGEKVKALATVGGPGNQSFLATVIATLGMGEFGEELAEVVVWLSKGLTLVGPGEPYRGLEARLDRDPEFREFAGCYLKSASTGVDGLEVHRREIPKDDLPGLVGDMGFRLLDNDDVAYQVLDNLAKGGETISLRTAGDGKESVVGRDSGHFYRISIQAAHEQQAGKAVRLELAEESDGTRRLLNLVPLLHGPRAAGVYFIDEIDRSLHPMLVREFLGSFLGGGGFRQIIVTTHETNLLDQDLLRRDEIWFAEKDQSAATRLYSLLDFKVRNDLDIRKGYLQGRFGAIPFLGGVEHLLPKAGQVE